MAQNPIPDLAPIQKDIPIPYQFAKLWPWDQLEVGDRFHVLAPRNRVQYGKTRAERRTGFRFALRTLDGGTRVWRVQ